jgi:excisionase family DNA binding protein
MDNYLTDTRGASEYLKLSASTLEKLRVTGKGPPYHKLGRAVRYRRSDLESWACLRLVSSTSAQVTAK